MRENTNIANIDMDYITMKLPTENLGNLKMTGEITDRIYKNGVLVDEIVGHNLIVNSFLNLIMTLCKGESNYGGIQYWAVGSGEDSWDEATPDPDINAAKLTAELGRVAIAASEINFLDVAGVISTTPTNIIQIRHIFGPDDCNGKWREFGIFGGNATPTADSGIMINKKHHSIITKTSEMSIERTMKFTLGLV